MREQLEELLLLLLLPRAPGNKIPASCDAATAHYYEVPTPTRATPPGARLP